MKQHEEGLGIIDVQQNNATASQRLSRKIGLPMVGLVALLI
jgi:hypothetical protein